MIGYEKVDKLVENCKNLYPDIPDYCLWVLACDYYINESRDDNEDDEEKKRRRKRCIRSPQGLLLGFARTFAAVNHDRARKRCVINGCSIGTG